MLRSQQADAREAEENELGRKSDSEKNPHACLLSRCGDLLVARVKFSEWIQENREVVLSDLAGRIVN